ncbi:arabinofuranosidase catalytic domain-containing protein [Plantactinospora solaniradicis]|uniref:Arabinofuranosidase catalytic domain-containing protein n=1 Tax=Plantactinospora solaniradicis TaxID=1723736 RepID=A0ABW1KPP9_9ACTN
MSTNAQHPRRRAPHRRRRPTAAATAIVLFLAAIAIVVGGTPAAAATVDTNAWYVLVNRASGKAMDDYGLATDNGAAVVQWTRHDGNNQQWRFLDSGAGYYRLQNRHSGKVLDDYNWSTADGTDIVQWTDLNGTNQQFRLADSDGGHVRLLNRHSGKAVEVLNASTADGGRVVQYADHGGTNQQWLLVRVGSVTPTPGATDPPCDIYAAGGTPCVAAHSTVRGLYRAYNGSLYQVRRASDNTTRNIGVLSAGGYANAAAQDSFCAGTSCVVTVVFDQSGRGNDLWYQGSAVVPGSPQSSPASATSESLTVSGNKAYSLYINPGNSYWRDGHLTGVPTGAAPEGMYMVTSGTHVNGGCCFDYGNSETTRTADAAGAMDAINFSTQCWFGGCSGRGPWVQADLEWGLFSGGSQTWNPNQRAFTSKFVTAMLKNNGTTRFALKGADAQSGGLTTLWDGALPAGYSPMKKQGAIILGSGGDCCKPNGGANLSAGTFYEGAMVAGYPTDATENAVQANIASVSYR